MKRFSFALLAFLLAIVPVYAYNWAKIVSRLQASTIQLNTPEGQGYCSGWVIDNTRDYVITAEHCLNSTWAADGIYIDDLPIVAVPFSSTTIDVAVLFVPGINRPSLKPRHKPVLVGDPLAAYGFAYGFPYPLFRVGSVSAVFKPLPNLPGLWHITDQAFIGGMSGGPVVDVDGKVFMMVQRSNNAIGIGKSIGEIWRATRQYWKS